MRLNAVDAQKGDQRDQNFDAGLAGSPQADRKWDADLPSERVHHKAWQRVGEIEVPRVSAPFGSIALDGIVVESCELRPEREL